MILEQSKLHYTAPWSFPDILLFTGNPVIANHGGIVMGRGAAKQCRDLFPGVDREFAKLLIQTPDANLLFVQLAPGKHLGWFKVKHHWQEEADLDLIQQSCQTLEQVIQHEKTCGHNITVHCNFPGIGNGRLTRAQVLPILQQCSDNVVFYECP